MFSILYYYNINQLSTIKHEDYAKKATLKPLMVVCRRQDGGENKMQSAEFACRPPTTFYRYTYELLFIKKPPRKIRGGSQYIITLNYLERSFSTVPPSTI